jgi:GNAT superfamily N-acetyltransferase
MQLETLRNEETVLLHSPTRADLEPMVTFFAGLPERERRYLRGDVLNPAWVAGLLREAETGEAVRIIAAQGDRVVGYGALNLSAPGTWQRHIAEIRVIVAPDHRGQRLGAHLIAALFRAAQQHGYERVVIKVPAAERSIICLCERLGFQVDAVLPGHMIDRTGAILDLAVLSCELDEVSRELRELYQADDWPDG